MKEKRAEPSTAAGSSSELSRLPSSTPPPKSDDAATSEKPSVHETHGVLAI